MNPDGTHAIIGHGYRNSYEQVVNSLGTCIKAITMIIQVAGTLRFGIWIRRVLFFGRSA